MQSQIGKTIRLSSVNNYRPGFLNSQEVEHNFLVFVLQKCASVFLKYIFWLNRFMTSGSLLLANSFFEVEVSILLVVSSFSFTSY